MKKTQIVDLDHLLRVSKTKKVKTILRFINKVVSATRHINEEVE